MRSCGMPAIGVNTPCSPSRRSTPLAVAIHGATSWESALAERYLGLAFADAGQLDEADKSFRAAIAYYDSLVGDGDHPLAATTRLALAETIARRPPPHAEAIALAGRAAEQRERLFGADDIRTKEARALAADLRAGKPRPSAVAIAMADP